MTGHENFVSELKAQAKQFDLTQMPINEAILKALEEKGLNSDLSKNPEFKNQMYKVFGSIFHDEYGNGMSHEKIETLRQAISSGSLKDYSFFITADGNFEYDKANDKDSITNPRAHKFFTIDKQGNLNVITTSKYSYLQEYDKQGKYAPETFTGYNKQQETFDKDGLQTHVMHSDLLKSNKQPYISGNSYRVTRNEDIATATYMAFDDCELDLNSIQDSHSAFSPYISSNSNRRFVDVDAIGQYPEQLNYPTIKYENLVELNQKLQEHASNLSQPGYPQNGTEFYEKLMGDYHCIPKAISADEKAFKQDYIKNQLEANAKISPLIKKIAEQRGLIAKEEVAIEQK